MKKWRRGLSRVLFHIITFFLLPLELVSVRSYMRVFTWFLRRYGVKFTGTPRYISSRTSFDDFNLVSMSERTVVSKGVILLTHDYSLTTALIANGDCPPTDVAMHRPIIIGRNVFVGIGAIVLPGTVIGDNVIVGAGSVLRGRIEPDSIIVGNPAVKIGTLTDTPDRWRVRLQSDGAMID